MVKDKIEPIRQTFYCNKCRRQWTLGPMTDSYCQKCKNLGVGLDGYGALEKAMRQTKKTRPRRRKLKAVK